MKNISQGNGFSLNKHAFLPPELRSRIQVFFSGPDPVFFSLERTYPDPVFSRRSDPDPGFLLDRIRLKLNRSHTPLFLKHDPYSIMSSKSEKQMEKNTFCV